MIVGHEMMNLLVRKPFKGDAGLSMESIVIKGDGATVESGHMVTTVGQSMRVRGRLQ